MRTSSIFQRNHSFSEFSPGAGKFGADKSDTRKCMCCAADGSANGAAPAVPQLSYSEMKDGTATLSPCSGLFILEGVPER